MSHPHPVPRDGPNEPHDTLHPPDTERVLRGDETVSAEEHSRLLVLETIRNKEARSGHALANGVDLLQAAIDVGGLTSEEQGNVVQARILANDVMRAVRNRLKETSS